MLMNKTNFEILYWTSTHEAAFQRLKQALTEAATLFTPEYMNSNMTQTDASQFGIGASISQKITVNFARYLMRVKN